MVCPNPGYVTDQGFPNSVKGWGGMGNFAASEPFSKYKNNVH